jgi:hypothetical protein
MKTKSLLLLFSFQFIVGCGYEYQERKYDRQSTCVQNKNFSVEERNQFSPYAESSRIAFVSYKDKKLEDGRNSNLEKYFKIYKEDSSQFRLEDFDEISLINEELKNQLTDLIYNYGQLKATDSKRDYMCYNPHNAILFLNEDNSLQGYIEICFNCDKYDSSSQEEYHLGEYCRTKLNLLRDLFKKSGIEYVGMKD